MISEGFNTMVHEFVKELAEVFPEEPILKKHADNFDSIVAEDDKAPMNYLLKVVGDKTSLIFSKDESIFDVVSIPEMNLKSMWMSISDTTQEAIWQYLNTLTMLATTMGNTPNELMSGIETMAAEFAEKMSKGDLDINSMMSEVMGRVQQMDLSSLEGMDIGALTKSMGIDPSKMSEMMSGMLGGVDPQLMSTVTSLMSGMGEEEDLLKLLESAKPPPAPKKSSSKKKSSKKKSSKK
jgi:hypothetical protein